MPRTLLALLVMTAFCLAGVIGCEEKSPTPTAHTGAGDAASSVKKEAGEKARKAAGDEEADDETGADDTDDADTEEVDEEEAEAAAPPKCPVSGDEADSDISTRYKDVTYYFCCDDCREAFLKNPDKFAKK